ncbi:type II toxin-antitoxin system mRNA interferase toxin, RelE/StbE family [Neisseria dumasiana]|uniref:type II toxin-antitoxin system RelE/ParE family toxin n=1 Tax=Neisseria dumasiana TaxID=1931275 RepID=UPI000A196759|nr:type II toxin-antitoxin system mRNA interferase toxin, RelE/StbE family [Neisseria dumasiana]
MQLKIEWSETALQNLDEIIGYIFEANPTAALSMIDLVKDAAQNLAAMPYLGRIGRCSGTRELIVHPNYIIVYKVNIYSIVIVNVLHTRQLYPTI